MYYHAILLTFRPFLVAYAFMTDQARQNEALWLRQACKYAVDAAQDSTAYIENVFLHSPGQSSKCKVREIPTRAMTQGNC